MKICHISDTHNCDKDLDALVPQDIDMLIFTGDLTYKGADWEIDRVLEQFRILSLRIPHIVGILGNHEVGCQGKETELKQQFMDAGVHLLHNNSVTIEGIKIWGTPYSPYFFNWAYQYENPIYVAQYAGEYIPSAKDIWDQVPEDTNILLSHGPPKFILDWCPNGNVGCQVLREKTESLPELKYSMFGHIHSGYGITTIGKVTYVNNSIMNNGYKFVNKPNIFNY